MARQPVGVEAAESVAFLGGGQDDVRATVVGVVDAPKFRVGDEDLPEHIVRDGTQQRVDAAAFPGAPVGVEVGVEVELGIRVTTNTSVPTKSSSRTVLYRSSTVAYSAAVSG